MKNSKQKSLSMLRDPKRFGRHQRRAEWQTAYVFFISFICDLNGIHGQCKRIIHIFMRNFSLRFLLLSVFATRKYIIRLCKRLICLSVFHSPERIARYLLFFFSNEIGRANPCFRSPSLRKATNPIIIANAE